MTSLSFTEQFGLPLKSLKAVLDQIPISHEFFKKDILTGQTGIIARFSI